MKYLFMLSTLMTLNCTSQQKTDAEFIEMADDYAEKFPTILSVDLKAKINSGKKLYILDTRKKAEYDISHLKNALFYGYDDPNDAILAEIPKDAEIIVYCSVGYRSGKVAKDLQKKGFSNIRNLYGGIFAWFNEANEVYDNKGIATQNIHTYNEKWSKWVTRGNKIY